MLAALAAVCLLPREAAAESAAESANLGLHSSFGPAIIFPSGGGSVGGGLDLELRYGIGAGPVIVAPGGRVAGYYISERFIGMGMPTGRITLPLGPLAPYLVGGVGVGGISNPGESGVALLGGGGLMIHFGRALAIGAEATYQTITNTGFKVLSIGPSIAIGF